MPTNLYGPNDNYDLNNSHVLPALIRKIHEAKKDGSKYVEIWGSGTLKREFLYVDDLAEACIFLLINYNDNSIINIGTGEDIAIKELAETIREIIGFGVSFVMTHQNQMECPENYLMLIKLIIFDGKPKLI